MRVPHSASQADSSMVPILFVLSVVMPLGASPYRKELYRSRFRLSKGVAAVGGARRDAGFNSCSGLLHHKSNNLWPNGGTHISIDSRTAWSQGVLLAVYE